MPRHATFLPAVKEQVPRPKPRYPTKMRENRMCQGESPTPFHSIDYRIIPGTAPGCKTKSGHFPIFFALSRPRTSRRAPIRVLCDTLISLQMWLPGRGLSSGGTPKGRGSRSRQGTTTLTFDTNGSVPPSTGSPAALVPATPGRRNEPAETRLPTHPSAPAVKLVGNHSAGPDVAGSTIRKCVPAMPTIQNLDDRVRPVTITPPAAAESS